MEIVLEKNHSEKFASGFKAAIDLLKDEGYHTGEEEWIADGVPAGYIKWKITIFKRIFSGRKLGELTRLDH